MVYGTYNELVTGAYKPTYNWGAHIVVDLGKRSLHKCTRLEMGRPVWHGPFQFQKEPDMFGLWKQSTVYTSRSDDLINCLFKEMFQTS